MSKAHEFGQALNEICFFLPKDRHGMLWTKFQYACRGL